MQFKLNKASDWEFEGIVEINTLEELLQFTEHQYQANPRKEDKFGYDGTIIEKDGEDWVITLYDFYLE